ncbi:MAG: Bifunctional methionine biosynthesis protein MetXA/MetW [Gammaproteobacteria bacterium]|nr:Bifunctional methionine biosynthesis protein MetXA/MetW [Gammaproteobacteria bacterium]
MATSENPDSYLDTRARFDDPVVAGDYVIKKNTLDNAKNRREMACIMAALTGLPEKSRVLDLPCGTGRLLLMLLDKGHTVVAADYARAMLDAAEAYHRNLLASDVEKSNRLKFQQEDILNTSFADDAFDAVICNRLFHHYPEAELRRQVLAELRRIAKNRIIVSFFSNFALSALQFHLGNRIRRITPNDRIPVWYREFERDITRSGLIVSEIYPVRYGISPQTYLKLVSD